MVTTPTWIYKGKVITEISDMPENTFGFIYEVTHLPTDKKYLGKKQLMSVTNKALGKKELALITDKRLSKKKDFKREILCFVPTKKLLTYYETKYLFVNEVLESGSNYFNDNIEGRYFRKDFI
jgi:hypothetical protein